MNAPSTRVQRRPVHGVLLLDKPLGLSSNNTLQRCKWLLRAEKAGHTGTLDPLATGVLPLCFGAATKFSQLQLEADKTYEAVVRLGAKTSTGDAEGEVIEQRPVPAITAESLAAISRQFTGPQRQIPPMYSALKKDGKALYEYARAGEEVEREARDIVVRELQLSLVGDTDVRMVARVSKGTYIRTLGEDIGEALGCGGHLVALRRIATGQYSVAQCVTLDAFEAMDEGERFAALLPVDSLLVNHTRVTLDADNAGRFLSGLRRRGDWADTEQVAVYGVPPSLPSPGGGRSNTGSSFPSPSGGGLGWGHSGATLPATLLGTAHVKGGELIPGRLLSPPEVEQIQESNS